MSAPPTIPPRPSRGQNSSSTSSPLNDMPKVPPRPKRNIDRSVSPNRDTFARSPLNDPAFLHNNQHKDNNLSVELPARPPSVSLPSLGEEGNEYASFEDLSKTLTNESEGSPQTKNVAGDLPLYAPKASVPSSTAKSRIQVVTRTDSSQAAAAGFGKLSADDKPATESGRSGSSAGGRSRPASMLKEDDEQGIPEIGVQVPMYPNAGDVQAPTPSPYDQPQQPPSSSGLNKPNRHHGRTKSGREIFHGPPGSYGMHGHGVISNDEFEQKWYAKHPEDLKREKAGEYGPHIQENRKDYHWKGDDLDKLVHQAGAKGVGLGTSREAIGTPDENIGYMASEEYASRMASPRPSSGRPASISGKAGPNTDSPLRQTAYPAQEPSKAPDVEDAAKDDVIHIDPPSHRASKIHGGGYDPPTEDLGPEGGNTEEKGGWVSERGYDAPILASDELEKHPEAEWRQPAVSPELQRHGDDEHIVNEDGTPTYITKVRTHSRSSSRNSGQRAIVSPTQFDRTGTPLEATKEYEPLFPEDEEPKKPKSVVDKLKRPDLARHHFPSQDKWEDTPSSLQLETTVETPQAPDEPETPGGDLSAPQVSEKPQTKELRKPSASKDEEESFLAENSKRYVNKILSREHLDNPARPGMQQRFPSQDIWEDAPDHGRLETTVSAPQSEETNEYVEDSPVAEKPTIPARPIVPGRPAKKDISPIDKKAPIIPDRPKPQVPVRPSKPATKSSEKVPTLESAAENEAAQPKAKPPVPARPGGSKIAALQSSFLKDLNSKLGLGPQAPKVKEPEEKEEEPAKPLQDARKGRAKGPQRRKPTASPTPAAAATSEVAAKAQSLSIAPVTTIWSISDDGEVDVPAHKMAAKIQEALKVPERSESVQDVEVEAEEAPLTKTDTKASEAASTTEVEQPELPTQAEPAKTVEPSVDVGAEDDTVELDAVGGVPLEGKLSTENPLKTAEEAKEHVTKVDEPVVVKDETA